MSERYQRPSWVEVQTQLASIASDSTSNADRYRRQLTYLRTILKIDLQSYVDRLETLIEQHGRNIMAYQSPTWRERVQFEIDFLETELRNQSGSQDNQSSIAPDESRGVDQKKNPDVEEGPQGPDAGVIQSPLIHFHDKKQFANLLSMIHAEYFVNPSGESCSKKEFFRRVAPLFAWFRTPHEPYDGEKLYAVESKNKERLAQEAKDRNDELLINSLSPPSSTSP